MLLRDPERSESLGVFSQRLEVIASLLDATNGLFTLVHGATPSNINVTQRGRIRVKATVDGAMSVSKKRPGGVTYKEGVRIGESAQFGHELVELGCVVFPLRGAPGKILYVAHGVWRRGRGVQGKLALDRWRVCDAEGNVGWNGLRRNRRVDNGVDGEVSCCSKHGRLHGKGREVAGSGGVCASCSE
jgi:hypothetical protein